MYQGSKKAGINWLIGSGVLALLSIGGWWVFAVALDRSATPPAVRLLSVERGTVETTINESGTVELGNQQTLKSPAEGAVDRVLVQPGDAVRQGQVLLTLRNPDRQTALTNQQIKIAQQQVTVSRTRQQVVEAQEQLAANQRRLATLLPLAQEGAIAQTQIQEIEDQIRTTIAARNTAQAEARTAALELQTLQLEQQRIEQELKGTVVTAPTSGVVLGVSVKDGDGVDRRTELLTLGNPAQELVQLQLSTLNAAQVQPNQTARISVIGANPQIYSARVQSLYPQAIAPAEADSSGQSSPTVLTTVRLDQPTRRLIPGSQVNVEIVLEQRQNVVAIDIAALQQAEADPFVWVMNGDRQVEQRSIDLGLEGLTSVEVRSGLRPGEQIVLPTPDQSLQPGMQVSPLKEAEAP